MKKIRDSIKNYPEVWVPLLYVLSVVVSVVLMGVFVLGPSNAEKRQSCEAAGGVIVSSGCIKRDAVVGY